MVELQQVTKQDFLTLYAEGKLAEVVTVGTQIYGKTAASLHSIYKTVVYAVVA